MPPVLALIGKPNCGKTTLIEKLIPALARKGVRTGTIKHHHGPIRMDTPGKDTWRHKRAGAESVLIASPWKLSLVKDTDVEWSLDILVSRYMSDLDIVLTEGYKRAGMPQVEVFRKAAHESPLHTPSDTGSLIAIMSDTPVALGVPNFDMDDVGALADLIETSFLK